MNFSKKKREHFGGFTPIEFKDSKKVREKENRLLCFIAGILCGGALIYLAMNMNDLPQ